MAMWWTSKSETKSSCHLARGRLFVFAGASLGNNELDIDDSAAPALSPELAALFERRVRGYRTRHLAHSLVVAALASVLTSILDLYASQALGLRALPWRVASAVLCLAGAFALKRIVSSWLQAIVFGVPAIAIMVLTEILGELSNAHYADRYMMAAIMTFSVLVTIPPHRDRSVVVMAGIGWLFYLLVPLAVPGTIPLWTNLDLPIFAAGMFAIAAWTAHRVEDSRRSLFLRTLHDESLAAEMTLLNAELLRLSTTDPLTGLANRRRLQTEMAFFWQDRRTVSLGVALVDIDHFKSINDSAGHAAGDICLRNIARAVAGVVREGVDCSARYGGEEFVAVVPNASEQDLWALGDRLCRAVRDLEIPHPGRPGQYVTVSVGLAWLGSLTKEADSGVLMQDADRSLYAAKDAGRDRVAFLGRKEAVLF
jgi:diguanylate cyclase (GGDEF)-like protein